MTTTQGAIAWRVLPAGRVALGRGTSQPREAARREPPRSVQPSLNPTQPEPPDVGV